MKNQKLSTKLIAAFMVVAAIALLIGVTGMYGIVRLKGHVMEVGSVRLPSLEGLGMVSDALSSIDAMENTLLSPACEPGRRLEVEKDIKGEWVRFKKGLEIYEPLPQTPEEAKLWKEFEKQVGEWKKNHEIFMTLQGEYGKLQGQKADEATLKVAFEKMSTQMFTGNDEWVGKAKETIDKVCDLNSKIGRDYTQLAFRDSSKLFWVLTFLVVIGLIVAIGLGVFVAGAISRPIRDIAKQLNNGAAETTEASGQVSSASQTLAQGSSEQAASLEETSSSLEQMASMTKRNAEHARHAKELAQGTHQSAEQASQDIASMSAAMDAVGQSSELLRAAMGKIESSSGQISQIMKTIDEIAFQTNILSLNAAVEAARAGEAGAGFAVVADEVRALAHRSAEASKQTAQMIKESSDSSHQGTVVTERVATDLANMNQASQRVKAGLQEILGKAKEVDAVIAEIATASQEQEQGISQVNMAVSQMDKVTQSNAASAEETASAAEQLNAQAEELKNSVKSLLRLADGGAADVTAHASPVTPIHRPETDHSSFQKEMRPRGTTQKTGKPSPGKAAAIPMDSSFQDMD